MTASRATGDAAARRREELAQLWLTTHEVSARWLAGRADSSAALGRLRSAGRLLGVWVAPEKEYRYPLCQFTHAGELRPEIVELLTILPRGNGSGWSQAEWLYAPHPRLGGRRPCDVLLEDAPHVVHVARLQFKHHPDANW